MGFMEGFTNLDYALALGYKHIRLITRAYEDMFRERCGDGASRAERELAYEEWCREPVDYSLWCKADMEMNFGGVEIERDLESGKGVRDLSMQQSGALPKVFQGGDGGDAGDSYYGSGKTWKGRQKQSVPNQSADSPLLFSPL